MPSAKTASKARDRKANLKPKAPIRRFDIFAEFNRQKAIAGGMPADQARGHGLWLAKVVAARRFRGPRTEAEAREKEKEKPEKKRAGKWKSLDGQPQTARLFEIEIVSRMGVEFYRRVFAPAVRQARREGHKYEDIRDSLRRDWKPRET